MSSPNVSLSIEVTSSKTGAKKKTTTTVKKTSTTSSIASYAHTRSSALRMKKITGIDIQVNTVVKTPVKTIVKKKKIVKVTKTKEAATKTPETLLVKVPSKNVPTSPNVTANNVTCAICLSGQAKEPTTTKCGHIFCHGCIYTAFANNRKCPMCQKTLGRNDLHRLYFN